MMEISDLEAMREWAAQRLSAGQEPPWNWYQLMKLREALAALIEAEGQTMQPTGPTPLPERRSETRLRLVADKHLQDSVPRHP